MYKNQTLCLCCKHTTTLINYKALFQVNRRLWEPLLGPSWFDTEEKQTDGESSCDPDYTPNSLYFLADTTDGGQKVCGWAYRLTATAGASIEYLFL